VIKYTKTEFTEDDEERETISSDEPQVILNAIEFLKKKINK
jgi:hypothetical protein